MESIPEELCNVCPTGALTISGEERSVKELIDEVEKDRLFYSQSGGGVTLSGGEPLSQIYEVEELLLEMRKGNIDTAIETSLHVPWENIEKCLLITDTFLVDLKHTDRNKFKQFTGGDAEQVLENISKLSKCHNNIIVRVPVIPGFNNTMAEMKAIIDFTSGLKTIREIHFLPFHNMGAVKYKMIGKEYLYKTETKIRPDELEVYKAYANSAGLEAKTGG